MRGGSSGDKYVHIAGEQAGPVIVFIYLRTTRVHISA
jgi:hypothetical protein